MSQTDVLAWKESLELKIVFSSIVTRIMEVCECPEGVADGKIVLGGPWDVNIGLNVISTWILEVWESPESIADRCIGLVRVTGVKNSAWFSSFFIWDMLFLFQ